MKLKGHDFDRPAIEIVAIPRGMDAETGHKLPDVILKCAAVKDFTEFDALCPAATPPMVIKPGGVKEANWDDPEYQRSFGTRAELRICYMILKSLQINEGLEWEKVVMGNPKTWKLYEQELKDAGFAAHEVQMIQNGVFAANSLNQSRVEEALANFLSGQQEQHERSTSGLRTDQDSSQSGDPASDSE